MHTTHPHATRRETEDWYRAILLTAMDGFWAVDAAGFLVEVNETYCRMSGYTADELIGRRVSDLEAVESPEETALRIERLMTAGEDRFVSAHRRKDGSVFPVEVSIQFRPIGGGRIVAFLRDITERHRKDSAMRRDEARFRSLSNVLQHQCATTRQFLDFALDEVIGLTASTMGFLYFYDEDRAEFVLNSWSRGAMAACSIVDPETRYQLEKTGIWGEVVRQRRPLVINDFDAAHPLKKGYPAGHAPLHRYLSVPVFAGERIVAVVAVANKEQPYDDTDVEHLRLLMDASWKVVETRDAEEALRQSETRNRAIAQSVNDAMVTTDSGGDIVAWNRAAETIFGYADVEMIGRSVTDLVPSRHRRDHLLQYERINSGLPPRAAGRTLETVGRRKDGREFPMELSTSAWETAEGWFVTSIMRDISERKNAEGVLRLEGAALKAAANSIVITDRDGVIEWANPAFTTFTGYPLDEAIGRKPGELLKSGTHDHAFYRTMWETILAGRVWHGEIVNRRKDGRLYTEDMTITPLKDDRHVITHFIAVKQDITQRKLLEEQFQQAQKMESVGRLAGGVAHDFNNMLGVIIGQAELGIAHVTPGHTAHSCLREIHGAAMRSAELTRQLLVFARKQAIDPTVLDLNLRVAGSLRMVERLIGEDIQLTWHPESDLWLTAIDPTQLDQILMNLCVNARDAIGDMGRVLISTANVVIDSTFCESRAEAEPGEYVRLSITDSGGGMSREVQSKIFEPFFTTKPDGQGTGLGLSTVYGAVRQAKGFITVDSAADRGTTFALYFPRAVGQAEEETVLFTPTLANCGSETVLVVDDESAMLRMSTTALEALGYTVLAAQSPVDAIRLASTHPTPIDALVTDVVMPGMNGRDLANTVRMLHPEIRIVYMSGYAEPVLSGHGLHASERNFIAKPFALPALAAKVREAIDAPAAPRR